MEVQDEEESDYESQNENHTEEMESTRKPDQPLTGSLFDNTTTDILSNINIVGGVVGSLLGLAIIVAVILSLALLMVVKKYRSEKGSGNTSGDTPGYHNAVYSGDKFVI